MTGMLGGWRLARASDAGVILRADRHDLAQPLQHLRQVAGQRRHDRDAIAFRVVGEQHAEAVVDAPAQRRQRQRVDAVVVGQRRIALRLEHLELVEPRAERADTPAWPRPSSSARGG